MGAHFSYSMLDTWDLLFMALSVNGVYFFNTSI